MIHPVTFYGATCDNCGKSWRNDHYCWSAMSDESGMKEMLSDDGWHFGEEGKHYCPDCFEFDDDDQFVLRKKHQ